MQGLSSERLLSVDLCEGFIQNWKKDEPHRRTPIDEIKEVKATGNESFIIKFNSDVHDYKLVAESPQLMEMYVSILQKISDKGFVPKKDDEFFPPYRRPPRPGPAWEARIVQRRRTPTRWAGGRSEGSIGTGGIPAEPMEPSDRPPDQRTGVQRPPTHLAPA